MISPFNKTLQTIKTINKIEHIAAAAKMVSLAGARYNDSNITFHILKRELEKRIKEIK